MKRNSSDEGDCDPSLTELKAAIELITSLFREPLEATGVALSSLQDEIEDAVDYARKYLALVTIEKCGTIFTFVQVLVLGPTFCFCVSWFSAYLFRMVE